MSMHCALLGESIGMHRIDDLDKGNDDKSALPKSIHVGIDNSVESTESYFEARHMADILSDERSDMSAPLASFMSSTAGAPTHPT